MTEKEKWIRAYYKTALNQKHGNRLKCPKCMLVGVDCDMCPEDVYEEKGNMGCVERLTYNKHLKAVYNLAVVDYLRSIAKFDMGIFRQKLLEIDKQVYNEYKEKEAKEKQQKEN